MSKTPEEIAYWKKVYPETNGNPPDCLLSEYAPMGQPINQSSTLKKQEEMAIVNITGYIDEVKVFNSQHDGVERRTLYIVMREEFVKAPGSNSMKGGIFYINKPELVASVEALLAKDPERMKRYDVKGDTYTSKRDSRTNPGEHYHTLYIRAWSFCESLN